jgi:hypothetical protein
MSIHTIEVSFLVSLFNRQRVGDIIWCSGPADCETLAIEARTFREFSEEVQRAISLPLPCLSLSLTFV